MKNASTDRGKRAKVYRLAAKMIEDGEVDYSCYAINKTLKRLDDFDESSAEYRRFRDFFCPEIEPTSGGWWGVPMMNPNAGDERIIALCLMAAITERP